MKEVLIFAGTTEGRKLSEYLSQAEIRHTACVATEYGEIVLAGSPFMKVHKGRMDEGEIKEFLRAGDYEVVIDATHPYAQTVTQNLKKAAEECKVTYWRLKREEAEEENYAKCSYFSGNESCAEYLKGVKGNILLTTGSKELPLYCKDPEVVKSLYVRILPSLENLELCTKYGVEGKHILAMQGPFSEQMNEAVIRQYGITCLVTKNSGMAGGYQEKICAARKAGIQVCVIGKPEQEEGVSFREICSRLEALYGEKIRKQSKMEIVLAGVGMGNQETATQEVKAAIERADILLGAQRMLAEYQPRIEKRPYYQAQQIIPYLKQIQERFWELDLQKVVILFSGDTGFYSGCKSLYEALRKEIEAERIRAALHILPGVSSVAYLAAQIGESYQDAAIYSMHGKPLTNLFHKIKREKKLFLLMSGLEDLHRLGTLLQQEELCGCRLTAGYQLSYEEQQILSLTGEECLRREKEGLYTCFLFNPYAKSRRLTHGKADGEFIRDAVPMTKEEVREVGICKLQLYEGAVVYDIGSGTGSIAVEIAGLSDELQVYAIEKEPQAVSLIRKNKEKIHLENISVVEAKAPQGLETLKAPTHAFIGGSAGKLKEILEVLYRRNSHMRVVISAVSMETICQIREVMELYPMKGEEVVQIQVDRMRQAGKYHLMQAENPVFLFSFTFDGTGEG